MKCSLGGAQLAEREPQSALPLARSRTNTAFSSRKAGSTDTDMNTVVYGDVVAQAQTQTRFQVESTVYVSRGLTF